MRLKTPVDPSRPCGTLRSRAAAPASGGRPVRRYMQHSRRKSFGDYLVAGAPRRSSYVANIVVNYEPYLPMLVPTAASCCSHGFCRALTDDAAFARAFSFVEPDPGGGCRTPVGGSAVSHSTSGGLRLR